MNQLLERFERIRRDPARLVDYLRQPRKLVVGGLTLNRLGLQAARAIKERVSWSLRTTEVPPRLKSKLETLNRDGFLVIENFLPPDEFRTLEAELKAIEHLPQDFFQTIPFGENFTSRLFMVSKHPEEYPAFATRLRDHQDMYTLACAVARRRPSYKPMVTLQWVHKIDPDKPHQDFEYNSYLHVDRHFPFLKAFLYLRDVDPDCAPYTYVKGSHKFNWDRLRFEYKLGVKHSAVRSRGLSFEEHYTPEQKSKDGGLVALAEELRDRQKLEQVAIAAKKNTLIISNNQGLHCRGAMHSRKSRVTANIDFKFLESWAHKLYPILKRLEK